MRFGGHFFMTFGVVLKLGAYRGSLVAKGHGNCVGQKGESKTQVDHHQRNDDCWHAQAVSLSIAQWVGHTDAGEGFVRISKAR